MDYFTNKKKLIEIQKKLEKVGLRLDTHYQEGSNMTTYHVVQIDENAGYVARAFGLDVAKTLATETSTQAISRAIDDIIPLQQVAHELINLGNPSNWFGA